jgi:hypothetical protein
VITKDTILWYITSCSPVKDHQSCGGTHYLHLQSRILNHSRTHPCDSSWFLASLTLHPEDRGSIFLRNVDGLLPGFRTLHPRRQYSTLQCHRDVHYDIRRPFYFLHSKNYLRNFPNKYLCAFFVFHMKDIYPFHRYSLNSNGKL